jgi:adenylate cyclase
LLDKLVVVGKTEPVEVFELLAPKGQTPADKAEAVRRYEEALHLHWRREWNKAIEQLDKALQAFARDAPSRILLQRIRGYLENPPPDDWDGRFIRRAKE